MGLLLVMGGELKDAAWFEVNCISQPQWVLWMQSEGCSELDSDAPTNRSSSDGGDGGDGDGGGGLDDATSSPTRAKTEGEAICLIASHSIAVVRGLQILVLRSERRGHLEENRLER